MTERDRYIAGVPCWVDAEFTHPQSAADFYGSLFGWQCDDSMPPDVPGHYIMGRIDGKDAAAISSLVAHSPSTPAWNTYVWVESADAAAAAASAAGGTIVSDPADVFDAGRMAMIADPEGARLALWEPNRHRGALAVNEHGGVVFNDLYTADLDRAAAFYGALFGWEVLELGPGSSMWSLPAYGDFLEERQPGLRASMAEMGAPSGFVNVVASIVTIDPGDADTTPHWGVTFAVDDADKAAATARELGATVLSEPTDQPWVRATTLADPQGAVFVASQFVPDNQ